MRRKGVLPPTLLCLLIMPLPVFGDPPQDSPDSNDSPSRGAHRVGTYGEEFAYRKKHAVVIGINYKAEDRAPLKRGTITPLDNAENDARAVATTLQECYGYAAEDVVLLLGKEATLQAIGEVINGLLDPEKVKKNDSVLFYFSGHGYLDRPNGDQEPEGYLLPFDVKMQNQPPERPDLGGATNRLALQMSDLKRDLIRCPARHKLLILDSCHSGNIFRINGIGGGRYEHERIDAGLFHTPAVQAISASRELQRANDRGPDSNHSPFTYALLRALKTIPPKIPRDRYYFTTNVLFHSMGIYLDEKTTADQSPQCRWLTGDQGEFHFFPDLEAEFVEPIDTSKMQRMLLAMVPSTFGNWWADETPWFMPSLRFAILDQSPASRSVFDDINKERLLAATATARTKLEATGSDLDRKRLRHLERMMSSTGRQNMEATMQEILQDLMAMKENQTAEAPDLHYLAVLQHKFNEVEQARETYGLAMAMYEECEKKSQKYRPLQALCYADLGYFHLNLTKEYDEAARAFFNARRMFGFESPAPFRIFTLCREADAYRKQGKWGLSAIRMEEALSVTQLFDKDASHLLSAATWRQQGWAHMEAWRFGEAAKAFDQAKRILSKNEDRLEAVIDRFHVEHGLAMTERFRGRDAEALKAYRRLTPEIAHAIRELEGRRDVLANYNEIRALFYQRLVNSLERQGDCNLFGPKPDLAEAEDDYRRALAQCQQLAEHERDERKATLFYKLSIALSVPSPTQDLERAGRLSALADQLCGISRPIDLRAKWKPAGEETPPNEEEMKPRVKPTPLQVFLGQLAYTLAQTTEDAASRQTVLRELRDAIKNRIRAESATIINRDDLEALMFASKLLLVFRQGADRFDVASDARQLLTFCRMAKRFDSADPETLAYLRQFYDAILEAKLEHRPKHVKELIEIAWEATRTTPYVKPDVIQPTLVMYCLGDCPWLFLDVPGGTSEAFRVEDVTSTQELRMASQTGSLLALPDKLRVALREVKGELVCRWHDPCQGLGFSMEDGQTRLSFYYAPTAKLRFPFELKAGAKAITMQEDVAGLPRSPSATVGSRLPAE